VAVDAIDEIEGDERGEGLRCGPDPGLAIAVSRHDRSSHRVRRWSDVSRQGGSLPGGATAERQGGAAESGGASLEEGSTIETVRAHGIDDAIGDAVPE
jgi:hypothetical protein